MNWRWTSIDSISAISPTEFDALHDANQHSSPFVTRHFLQALEQTHCVGTNSGWTVKHLVIFDEQNTLIAFLPAYLKTHSYGEYVFDHSWAHAYEQHGLAYYPKLIVAIPFTPVTGPRVLLAPTISLAQMSAFLGQHKQQLMATLRVSSIHILFSPQEAADALLHEGFHQRQSVQFNWHNQNYTDFDHFMSHLTARRRRSIRKERSSIAKQGVVLKRIVGSNISYQDMAFFYRCYEQTYLKRSGHSGYLRPDFFQALLSAMPSTLLLVVAYISPTTDNTTREHALAPIGAALFLHDSAGLYGRYWGALEEVSGLHFEACYYQGIEFCIEQNIPLFNPGTQGEHKILRGFAPTLCYSNHALQEPAFDRAVADFLSRETPHIIDYAKKSAELLPYKELISENDT